MSIIVAIIVVSSSASLGVLLDCIHAFKLMMRDGASESEYLVVVGILGASSMIFGFSIVALQSWNAGWYVYLGVVVVAAVLGMTLIAGSHSVKSR